MTRPRVLRAGAALLLLLELAGIAWLVLTPSPRKGTAAVDRVTGALRDLGVPPPYAGEDLWEFLLNVALFVPLGLLVPLLFGRVTAWIWVVAGVALSGGLEWAQRSYLPERTSTASDFWANSLGVVLGVTAAVGLRHVSRGRLRRAAARPYAGEEPHPRPTEASR